MIKSSFKKITTMHKRIILLNVTFLFIFQFNIAQNFSLDYYLPTDVNYNTNIPKPNEIIGFVPGDWHVSHDRMIQYMTELSNKSERISIKNIGHTFERRPLIQLIITSPENHNKTEDIKKKREVLVDEKLNNVDFESTPLVVNLGFCVHGNEPSSVNSTLVLAYYLAAAEDDNINKLLSETVIILDPTLNPDGVQRFANWTNSNRSTNLNPDPNDREFDETWPGGRTNHYWFDLNRDWLPVQLPESQARIESFYEWRPNVVTDHHEMGSNSTFFFQPGIPQRTNPFTPQLNQELTEKIGNFHAKALDSVGSLYYSKESFDDFYYGKGSTFPDINGSVGILFEQASSRGSGQMTQNGLLEFKYTIKNQFITALSTLKGALAIKTDLLKLQDNFYHEAIKNAGNTHYIVDSHKNPFLAKKLHEVLSQHKIKTYKITEDKEINGKKFNTSTAFAIPLKQQQGRLAKAMFESRTTFKDSIFYDVSAWDFQHAFGVDFAKTKSLDLGEEIKTYEISTQKFAKSDYAYAIRWNDFYSPKLIYKLQNKGLRVYVSTKLFSSSNEKFDYGTAILPIQKQNKSSQEIFELLNEFNSNSNVEITALNTGLTSGINLGSPNVDRIIQPKIAMMVGEGVRAYDAGEIWHLLDVRLQIPVTKLDTKNFRASRLDKYTHLVIPSSSSRFLSKSDKEQLKSWVRNGGTIIGYRSTARWLSSEGLINLNFKNDSLVAKDINFESRRNLYGSRQIGGAIFQAKIDRTHPINFGYANDKIALFRNTELFITPNKYSFNNPIQYTENPLLSGYINDSNLDLIKETVPFQVNRYGSGRVIVFTDNTNFRGFWLGSTKLFINSLFLSDLM